MEFIEGVENWWKLWSVRIMAVPVFIAGVNAAFPGAVTGLTEYVPEEWRPIAMFGVTCALSAAGIWARTVKQPKLSGGDDAE